MSYDLERLYNLLPAIYRIRDVERAEPGPPDPDTIPEPLRAFVAVLAEQAEVLEESIAQLYDDQFIDTCAEWVVPYIGDLVRTRGLVNPASSTLSTRAQVANTLRYRRRKGTAAVLELLAHDVTGWDSHVVEYFQRLATTQYLNHLRPANRATVDLRNRAALERIDTPFDTLNRTLEVRRIQPRRGRYNIQNVGIHLWRLAAFPVSRSPAQPVDGDVRRYRFDPLGIDTQLVTLPEPEADPASLSSPQNVPLPISRRMLAAERDVYYGPRRSILVTVDGAEIDGSEIVSCNLSDTGPTTWANTPRTTYAIDPVLGRLALPQSVPASPAPKVVVTFHTAFSAEMGGGEYARIDTLDDELVPVARLPKPAPAPGDFQNAVDAVGGGGSVEIGDNDRYAFDPARPVAVDVQAGARVELRAADGRRPLLLLPGATVVRGADESELTLNGLLVVGGPLIVRGSPALVRVRHCTLVPGHVLNVDGTPVDPGRPSLIVESPNVRVEVERSIVGALYVNGSSHTTITDSIVDANSETNVAYAAPTASNFGGAARIERSTVIGRVRAESLELASNSIFFGRPSTRARTPLPVEVQRRQEGCVRFSYLHRDSIAPRRYRCRPAAGDDAAAVQPTFTSLSYGDPPYCQLDDRCPVEITTGADDTAEMGVFHDLYQHQREANLQLQLEEYLRFGLEAGIFHAS